MTRKAALLFASSLALYCPLARPALAQGFSPFAFSYEIFPYENLANPPAGAILENARIQAEKLQAYIAIPLRLPRESGVFVGLGVAYERLGLNYENWGLVVGGPPRIRQLHSLGMPINLRARLNERWSLLASAVPGIESDFEGQLGENDFSMQGSLIFQRSLGRGFSLGFGGIHTRSLGRPVPLPAVSWDWRLGRWSASGLLPLEYKATFDIMQELSAGIDFRINGSRYHGDPYRYALNEPNIRYRDVTLGPLIRLRAGGGATLELETGLAFSRRFRLYDGDVKVLDYDLKDTMFTRIGIRAGGGMRRGRGGGGRGE